MMNQEASALLHHRVQHIEESVHNIERMLRELQADKKSTRNDQNIAETFGTSILDAVKEQIVNGTFSRLTSSAGIASKSINDSDPQLLHQHHQSPSFVESERSLPVVDLNGLLSILGSSDIPARDLQRCLANGRLLSLEDQDRVKWIMRSPKLRKWLNHPRSKTILVNGNKLGNEVFSPTTFRAAKMVETLQAIEPVSSLQFFCSLRSTMKNDVKDNAITMLKSLVAQLLLSDVAWDLTSNSQEDVDRIQGNDQETLREVFCRLLQQLPKMTFLYWIIDGITFYERAEWRRDFLEVVIELLNIMDSCKQVVIKLLLTCHGRSFFVKDYIDDADILLVPSIVDGDRQGWSDVGWHKSTKKDMDALENTVTHSSP